MEENTNLYELLGVSKDATDAEIKKNYHKLAKEFHPDKNLDDNAGDKFKEISFAYEVLSNKNKRKTYDKYGLEGLQKFSDGDSDAADLFAQWFPLGRQSRQPSKPSPQEVKVPVKLEDMYNGNVNKKVDYQCMEYCDDCEGIGGPENVKKNCETCTGTGRILNYSLLGLGVESIVCHHCGGRGFIIPEEMHCHTCSGMGMLPKNKSVNITIEKGVPNLYKIPFPGAGNQHKSSGERSDIVVVLVQEPHDCFVRDQNNLHLRLLHINLTESLCTFKHCIEHLDGRNLIISTQPGEVIKHEDLRIIKGEGMPLRNNPFERGDLIIQFHIDFPENNFASSVQLAVLERLLPPREKVVIPEDAERVEMVEPQTNSTAFGNSRYHDDKDDYDTNDDPHVEGVQCQTA